MAGVSFVFGWRGSPDFYTLSSLYTIVRQELVCDVDYEIIIVDYGTKFSFKAELESKILTDKLRVIYTHEQGRYNDAKAKNVGIRKAKFDVVCCCSDPSLLFAPNFLDEVGKLDLSQSVAMCRSIYPSKEAISKLYPSYTDVYASLFDVFRGSELVKDDVGHIVIIIREELVKLRGYDEEFFGIGTLESDLYRRAKIKRKLATIWLNDRTVVGKMERPNPQEVKHKTNGKADRIAYHHEVNPSAGGEVRVE